jgi:hypothetical protein
MMIMKVTGILKIKTKKGMTFNTHGEMRNAYEILSENNDFELLSASKRYFSMDLISLVVLI